MGKLTANPAQQKNIIGILSNAKLIVTKENKELVLMKVTLQNGTMIDVISDPLFVAKQFNITADNVKNGEIPGLGDAINLCVQQNIAFVTTYVPKDGTEPKLHERSGYSLVEVLHMNEATKGRVEKVVAIQMLGFEVTQENVLDLMSEAVQL
ncbi:hypothetical protein DSECCO2_120340 [anaerobic digester metagenome]